MLLPGGEPFLFQGTGVNAGRGVVLVHGFSASPAEVRWLGADLAAAGYTVAGVRLAGHATTPADLARVRWRDWLSSVHDGYHLLRPCCASIAFVGHSLGGLLALLAAAELPAAGSAVLASPLAITSPLAAQAHLLRLVLPYTDQTDTSGLVAAVKAEQRRRGEPERGRVRYDRWPTAAVAELHDLVAHTRSHLADVTTPVLLVYAEQDRTVPIAQMGQLAARLVNSRKVTQHRLLRGGHIIPQDADQAAAFAAVRSFLAELWTQTDENPINHSPVF